MNDDQLDAKLDEHFARFGAKLFEYLDVRFGEVSDRIGRLESRVQSLEGLIDTVIKQQEIDQHERLGMSRQLDRHERWHQQAAAKLGMKLDYR